MNPRAEGEVGSSDGVLADTWVDIDQDSTMMGAVKEAIEVAGYTQEGAESGYIS